MWIFGYGSLLWYTNFPYERKIQGHLLHFARRFWQTSPDHRGTHENPGRTVTLIDEQQSRVHGYAYQVPADKVEEVTTYLHWREKAGYEMRTAKFYPDNSTEAPFYLHVFVSSPTVNGTPNEHYTNGKETIDQIADVVVISHGPSGSNIAYVLKVAHALRQFGKGYDEKFDEHIFKLEQAILRRCREMGISDECFKELGLTL